MAKRGPSPADYNPKESASMRSSVKISFSKSKRGSLVLNVGGPGKYKIPTLIGNY